MTGECLCVKSSCLKSSSTVSSRKEAVNLLAEGDKLLKAAPKAALKKYQKALSFYTSKHSKSFPNFLNKEENKTNRGKTYARLASALYNLAKKTKKFKCKKSYLLKALNYLQKAIKDHQHESFNFNLGNTLVKLGELHSDGINWLSAKYYFEKARAVFIGILKKNPAHQAAKWNLELNTKKHRELIKKHAAGKNRIKRNQFLREKKKKPSVSHFNAITYRRTRKKLRSVLKNPFKSTQKKKTKALAVSKKRANAVKAKIEKTSSFAKKVSRTLRAARKLKIGIAELREILKKEILPEFPKHKNNKKIAKQVAKLVKLAGIKQEKAEAYSMGKTKGLESPPSKQLAALKYQKSSQLNGSVTHEKKGKANLEFGLVRGNGKYLRASAPLDKITLGGFARSKSVPNEPKGKIERSAGPRSTIRQYVNKKATRVSLFNTLDGRVDPSQIRFFDKKNKLVAVKQTAETDKFGQIAIKLGQSFEGSVEYSIYKFTPKKGSAKVYKQYAKPAPFKINYPNELKKKLTEWENLPTAQKVKNLKKWVKENLHYDSGTKETALLYKNRPRNIALVNAVLAGKWKVDCDVANIIFATILRTRYKIPARLAAGFHVSNGRIEYNDGHAWTEVFYNGKWNTVDTTPPGRITNTQHNNSSTPGMGTTTRERKRPTKKTYFRLRNAFLKSKEFPPSYYVETFSELAKKLGKKYRLDAYNVIKHAIATKLRKNFDKTYLEFSNAFEQYLEDDFDFFVFLAKHRPLEIRHYYLGMASAVKTPSQLKQYFNILEKNIGRFGISFYQFKQELAKDEFKQIDPDIIKNVSIKYSKKLLRLGLDKLPLKILANTGDKKLVAAAIAKLKDKKDDHFLMFSLAEYYPDCLDKVLNFIIGALNQNNYEDHSQNLFYLSARLKDKPRYYKQLERGVQLFYKKALSFGSDPKKIQVRKRVLGEPMPIPLAYEPFFDKQALLMLSPIKLRKKNIRDILILEEEFKKYSEESPYSSPTDSTFEIISTGLAQLAKDRETAKKILALTAKLLSIRKRNNKTPDIVKSFARAIAFNYKHWDIKTLRRLGRKHPRLVARILKERIDVLFLNRASNAFFKRNGHPEQKRLIDFEKLVAPSLKLLQKLTIRRKNKRAARKIAYYSLRCMQGLFSIKISTPQGKKIAKNLAALAKIGKFKLEELVAYVDLAGARFAKKGISWSEFIFWGKAISTLLPLVPKDKQYLSIRKIWFKVKKYPKRLRLLLPTIAALNYSYVSYKAGGGQERRFYDERLENEILKTFKVNFLKLKARPRMLLASRLLVQVKSRFRIGMGAKNHLGGKAFYLSQILKGNWKGLRLNKEMNDNLSEFILDGLRNGLQQRKILQTIERKFRVRLNIPRKARDEIIHPRDGIRIYTQRELAALKYPQKAKQVAQ